MEHDIILVDKNDNQICTGEKISVHKADKLHRCFSIFIFNTHGKMMMQKRAARKYHSGGLWTNTCCGHPRPGEDTLHAAHTRLQEEMGFDCELKEVLTFTYKKAFANSLTEHEFDHVLIGTFDGEPNPNPKEADGWKWITPNELTKDMQQHPENYTYWFSIVLEKVLIAKQ